MADVYEGLQAPLPFDEVAWAWQTDQEREQEVDGRMGWFDTGWAHESGYRQFLWKVLAELLSPD